MTQRLLRRATTFGLLAGLACLVACTTVSKPAVPPAPGSSAPATRVVPLARPISADAGGIPSSTAPVPVPLPQLPAADDTPSTALSGEVARELERGGASWYGPGFHGRRTASGERYNMHAFTAAHRTLPFGTLVRVRSLVNGREVEVRITDRGPFSAGRIIDVSRAAAQELGMLGLGIKAVVLFVPDSTPAVAEAPPARKRPRSARRPAGPKAR